MTNPATRRQEAGRYTSVFAAAILTLGTRAPPLRADDDARLVPARVVFIPSGRLRR